MQPDNQVYYKKAEVEQKFLLGDRYLNPFPLFKLRKFQLVEATKFFVKNMKSQLDPKEMKEILPAKILTKEKLINKKGVLRAVWIGHATVLIQDGPVNILTYPLFSFRVPDAFYGYKRLNELPISLNDLPQIHAVILSHDHHDHCNTDNLNDLHKIFKPEFFAGKQSADMFNKNAKIHEMNWTEMVEFTAEGRKYKVHFVPACHWSGRSITDHNKRLWGGFVIETPDHKKIFYPGDTGYCQVFQEIGEYFGEIDLSLIPIGAYCPREFLRFQHIDPEEAVKVHQQTNTKQSLAIHWATFQLACQKPLQPREDMQAALDKLKVKQEDFIAFMPGNILTTRIPVLRPVFEFKHHKQMTWFGHSTLLLQLSKINILINPVFSNTLDNKIRYTDFPIKIQDLPKIDIILVNQPISLEDLSYPQLSQSVVLTNKKVSSKNILKQTTWTQGSVKIELVQFKNTSSFFIHFQNEVFQICENLVEQPINQLSSTPTFLFLPLRPFQSSESEPFDNFHLKYKTINPVKLIPINWGSFEYQSENIVEPLLDLDKHFPLEIKNQRLIIPVVGKTVIQF